MTSQPVWYRSGVAAPEVTISTSRSVRNWLMSWLPEPDVRAHTMVLCSRRTFPKPSSRGLRSAYHGLFSEFHSVLGALAYAEAHESAGVRIDFRSPLYIEADRGPNWWTYFFDPATIRIASAASESREVHVNRVITKYGRFGGFSDIVGGPLAYLYPMKYGLSRAALHRLVTTYVRVRPAILNEVARFTATRFRPGAYIVGVHYRGTDSTRNKLAGALTHYRTSRTPYRVFADEVRYVLETAAPRSFQIFVATDEIDFLEFMQGEFGSRVVCLDEAPRVRPHQQPIHLNPTLPVSNYQKGKSALVDCLILAATSYLVKGRSNLSDASLAFNPQLPYSFCPDVSLPLTASR
jgi:hypothetical protein